MKIVKDKGGYDNSENINTINKLHSLLNVQMNIASVKVVWQEIFITCQVCSASGEVTKLTHNHIVEAKIKGQRMNHSKFEFILLKYTYKN